jgi:UDP-N-acetylglucosamine 2-epimerase (non-hydrolysing)
VQRRQRAPANQFQPGRAAAPEAPPTSLRPVAVLHVFLGTKAQYIKTAPLLRLMDERGVRYRLIDSGQHAALSTGLRRELGVREPDHLLGGVRDVTTTPQALLWSLQLSTALVSADRLRRQVFGGEGGICVVHGDTPSTFLSALMAKRAGLRTAHLEAGLRSHSLVNPFPEELVRLAVMRSSDLLFAPDAEAVRNLHALRLKGRIVPVGANTVVEAMRHSLADRPAPGSGPVVITMHRVENLRAARRTERLVALAGRIAAERPVTFVLHGPTSEVFARRGLDTALRAAGVQTVPLVPHGDFVRMLAAAPFVITDGGSVQEECALLGVPTLLWRLHTERGDGLGDNVVLSRCEDATVDAFLADPEAYRRAGLDPGDTPSEQILDVLLADLRSAEPG